MNENFHHWLGTVGVTSSDNNWVYWTIVVSVIAFVVLFANLLCRRLLIPLVKQVIKRTRSSWDDILFNDVLLRDVTHLVPPILIAVLMPMAFSGENAVLEFLLKVNTIYLIAVIAKLICTFLTSLYELSNHQNHLKNHPTGYNDGHGKYKYPHDFGGYVKQQYLPDELKSKIYYIPKNNGRENNLIRKKNRNK